MNQESLSTIRDEIRSAKRRKQLIKESEQLAKKLSEIKNKVQAKFEKFSANQKELITKMRRNLNPNRLNFGSSAAFEQVVIP